MLLPVVNRFEESETVLIHIFPNVHKWIVVDEQGIPMGCWLVENRGERVLIDPAWDEEVLPVLEKEKRPTAILLTTPHHERDVQRFREHFKIPVYASEAAILPHAEPPDFPIRTGTLLPGELIPIPVDGAAAGEVLFFLPEQGGLLFVGDLFHTDAQAQVHLIDARFASDIEAVKASVRNRLLHYDFDVLLVSHGLPVLHHAREMVRQLVA